MYVKNVHPEYSAGIWTQDIWNITTRPGLPPKKYPLLIEQVLSAISIIIISRSLESF